MSNVTDASGGKAWVQMEWEQVDAIVRHELREQIITTAQPKGWQHPDDIEYDKILLPALKIVYEYFAGEQEFKKLEEELNANGKTV